MTLLEKEHHISHLDYVQVRFINLCNQLKYKMSEKYRSIMTHFTMNLM